MSTSHPIPAHSTFFVVFAALLVGTGLTVLVAKYDLDAMFHVTWLNTAIALTGLHALHMLIGFGILGTITWMAYRGRFSEQWYTPVEMSGLYWHFVDIVWIFLFPLLYLVDRVAA